MKSYTIYESKTGNIKYALQSSSGLEEPELDATESLVEGFYNTGLIYISDGEPIERPTMQPTVSATEVLADGVEEVLITNLPISATVNINGQVAEVDDGELTLTFETPGEYRLTVEAFPHKPWEVTIHAT